MPSFTLEIECTEDGRYVCSKEDQSGETLTSVAPMQQAAPAAPVAEEPEAAGQTFTDPAQVQAWVAEQLGSGASPDPRKSWDAEASSRDSQGYRKPGAPAMTM